MVRGVIPPPCCLLVRRIRGLTIEDVIVAFPPFGRCTSAQDSSKSLSAVSCLLQNADMILACRVSALCNV